MCIICPRMQDRHREREVVGGYAMYGRPGWSGRLIQGCYHSTAPTFRSHKGGMNVLHYDGRVQWVAGL